MSSCQKWYQIGTWLLHGTDMLLSALQELRWLPVTERIQYKLCLLAHKSLLGHMPVYISDLLTSVADVPARSALRSSSSVDLVVPPTRRRISDSVLPVTAPLTWHMFSTQLKLSVSLVYRRFPLPTENVVWLCLWTDWWLFCGVRSVSSRGRTENDSVTVTV